MEQAPLILLVDDDPNVCRLLKLYLGRAGYRVLSAPDGVSALEIYAAERPDLAILDIMLPGLDGREICRRIREQDDLPIIFLTARDATGDRVAGLDMGADDYIVKPFDPNEVVARVRARLRRRNKKDLHGGNIVTAGNLEADPRSFEVKVDGIPVELKPREFQLLYFLAAYRNRVFTREQLLERIWGYDYAGETRTVDVHIQRLREKLAPGSGWEIRTIRGVGYKMEVCEDVP